MENIIQIKRILLNDSILDSSHDNILSLFDWNILAILIDWDILFEFQNLISQKLYCMILFYYKYNIFCCQASKRFTCPKGKRRDCEHILSHWRRSQDKIKISLMRHFLIG